MYTLYFLSSNSVSADDISVCVRCVAEKEREISDICFRNLSRKVDGKNLLLGPIVSSSPKHTSENSALCRARLGSLMCKIRI